MPATWHHPASANVQRSPLITVRQTVVEAQDAGARPRAGAVLRPFRGGFSSASLHILLSESLFRNEPACLELVGVSVWKTFL